MDINKESIELINKLTLVKDEFIKNRTELAVSIRKDVVIATLKDMLQNCTEYDTLKKSIQNFIEELKIIEKEDKNGTNDK